ncbi:hypothetical protein VT1337_18801 [Vibrio tubiashii NCIMB 1337 = ATCC 19106]|uniref:Uncharacterized protein n=1 Tax=Vibrio tubiashii ATCC 19109 TaxID=1051646 RepID=A0ABN0D9V7_9VIBR|nr:hypothetical protein VITU9109_20821 [Vibrio tubiashii ATCC 19109]EIF02439.1 hypothetical protein VT1337_18801 [Vibrio tubiashii NCIMB 1337 = ATCC 19106]
MQHQEMIQPSNFGLIGRTCLFSLIGIVSVFTLL